VCVSVSGQQTLGMCFFQVCMGRRYVFLSAVCLVIPCQSVVFLSGVCLNIPCQPVDALCASMWGGDPRQG
jgi:hypothetical protein